jgi:hypothetical protein
MSQSPGPVPRVVLSPTSQMAFAVAFCALAAAAVGSIVNHWLTGWMAVGGMVGVGLFYFAIGVLNLSSKPSGVDEKMISSVSQRTAGADNLVAEAVVRPPRSDTADSPGRFEVKRDD